MLLLALFTIGFTASEDDPNALNKNSDPAVIDESGLQGIVPINSSIGDWSAAYLTDKGYFCYSKSLDKKTEGTNNYSSITYMSKDGKDMLSLISTSADNLPTQLVIKDKGIIYFSFPNDSIVELVYDDSKKVELLGSFKYPKANLPSLSDMLKGDVLKSVLANAASLIKANTASTATSSVGNAIATQFANLFDMVTGKSYEENAKAISELAKAASGNYKFSETMNDWYVLQIGNIVFNRLSIWTGEATYRVGGSSCTLSGTIWCPSNLYNVYGTYGIICDADPEKLKLGEAEYEGTGYQPEDKLSFDVDFRGFKPNTTYYYKAFYKFNSGEHGDISGSYGGTEPVLYDTTVKSFKTGDNVLTVNVAMCIDVTGSMSGIINTVKNNAISFYDSFKKCCDDEGIVLAGLNAQVIAYQDVNVDGDRWLQISDTYSLPAQKNEYDNFVNGLYADAGGDIPESGLEALEYAFKKSDWGVDDGYHRQVVILWTDAPYLIGEYSSVTLPSLQALWDEMPSGRRLILFAPYGNGYFNGGDWEKFDTWTNVIHESDLYSGFYNFEYILKSIIGELTSKASSRSFDTPVKTTHFRPNK